MKLVSSSFLFLSLVLAACSAEQIEGDFMYLRNDGADLPVWVRGNTESGTFIVWLASGPGDPVEVMRGEATDRLEQDHAVVYWDQRGCGSAQGNPAPETFTIDQFVEDTDQVVELVRQRYDAERIFLLGHSWGGTLGVAYLLEEERREKIAGFIDVAGNHDHPLVFPMKLHWLARDADERIARGERVDHWRSIAEWARSQPPLTVANFERWSGYVDETDGAFFDGSEDFDIDFDLLFRSPQSPLAYLFVNKEYVVESLYHDDEVFQSLSFTERMPELDLPILLLWGRHDGIVPLEAGEAALSSLASPRRHARLEIVEDAAHFPFLEQPDAFVDAVEDFVAQQR